MALRFGRCSFASLVTFAALVALAFSILLWGSDAGAAEPLVIEPGFATTSPFGAVAFQARGGTGAFHWSVATNVSGAQIDSTGNYRAGLVPNVQDVVQVTDDEGEIATAAVDVGGFDPLVVAPRQSTLPPRATRSIKVSGGYPPYHFSFISNASSGNVAQHGVYLAGPKGNRLDIVRITDAFGQTSTSTFSVTAEISVEPKGSKIAPRDSIGFTAKGGSGIGFVWSIAQNPSGGNIDASTGAYAAGPGTNCVDVIRATDSLGNIGEVSVSIGGGVAIEPLNASTWPLGTIAFTGFGGTGEFAWRLVDAPSGGTIDPVTGAYRAGPLGGVQDEIEAMDPLGNRATRTISVSPAIQLSPGTASAKPGETVLFSVAGGSGHYVFLGMDINVSEGSLSTDFVYKAGPKAGRDGIFIRDSEGSIARATVDVTLPVTVPSEPSTSSTPSSAPKLGLAGGGTSGCGTTGAKDAATSGALAMLGLGLAMALRRRRDR
jgi:MYXO-CTERM domain-containing protein